MLRRLRLLIPRVFLISLAACAGPLDYGAIAAPAERALFRGSFEQVFNKAFEHYMSLPGKKAFAMAKDPNGRWTYAMGQTRFSQRKANATALSICEAWREKFEVKRQCSIYAVGGYIVWQKTIVRPDEAMYGGSG